MKTLYTKQSISISDQVSLLEEKGMEFYDKKKAATILSVIGYYRFSGYAYSFRNKVDNSSFVEGTSFEKVYSIYDFDRNLKLLLFDYIERIEIAFRTQMINRFSQGSFSSFWFENLNLFVNKEEHILFLANLKNEIVNSQEDFICHFTSAYTNNYPPAWITLQLISFGGLIKLYRNFKGEQLKNEIANFFGCESTTRFISWINALVYLRNLCGHHVRLWNISIKKCPAAYHFGDKGTRRDNSTLYFSICIAKHLLDTIYPENRFKDKIASLFAANTYVDHTKMIYIGFPKNWQEDNVWK